jgi:hypothetical protein
MKDQAKELMRQMAVFKVTGASDASQVKRPRDSGNRFVGEERSLMIRNTLDQESVPRDVAEVLNLGPTVCYALAGK